MRFLLKVNIPVEAGNAAAKAGKLGATIQAILAELKPEAAYFMLAPDWICEVLSRSTETVDRTKKLPIYAAHGVSHVWLIDPIAKTLEVHSLGDDHRWRDVRVYEGDARVRAEPFAAIELDLASLWVR